MKETQTTARDKEYLTARQLAEVLQVSAQTVRRLAREGKIPSVRLTPRLIRFHLRSVRDALTRAQKASTHGELDPPVNELQMSFDDLLVS